MKNGNPAVVGLARITSYNVCYTKLLRHQSFCLLFSSKGTANARLKVLEKTNDGFEIAQKDLKLRGAGQFFGTQQSGIVV